MDIGDIQEAEAENPEIGQDGATSISEAPTNDAEDEESKGENKDVHAYMGEKLKKPNTSESPTKEAEIE